MTYSKDKFLQEKIDNIIQKYQTLISGITNQGWKVDPLIVMTTRARRTTHAPSMKHLNFFLKLLGTSIKNIFKEINTIPIDYTNSILFHKRK